MKILICTPEFPPLYSSGIGNVVDALKKELTRYGINCATCSTMCSDISLCNGVITKNFANIRSLYVSYFWYLAREYIETTSISYDIIWAHDPMPHFIKNFPDRKNLVITFHTIHSYYLQYSRYPKFISQFMRCLEKDAFKRIPKDTKIIAVSTKVVEELEELGVNRERISHIPNGVDTDVFKPSYNKKLLRKELGLSENDMIFLTVGKLKEQKRPLKLIELFSSIETSVENARLIVIGHGKLLDKAKKFAKKKAIERISFLGYVHETQSYYACADYYLMASQYEGQPLTLLEAMSSGLPCIVSDIPNLSIVEDAKCGIIIDFDNLSKETRNVINYIAITDNHDHAMNARNYCMFNLSWRKIAEKYVDIFNSLIH